MSARCKALCKKAHFHYGLVTNGLRRRFARLPGRRLQLRSLLPPLGGHRLRRRVAGPRYALLTPAQNLHRQHRMMESLQRQILQQAAFIEPMLRLCRFREVSD
jgi:hypothetical protein